MLRFSFQTSAHFQNLSIGCSGNHDNFENNGHAVRLIVYGSCFSVLNCCLITPSQTFGHSITLRTDLRPLSQRSTSQTNRHPLRASLKRNILVKPRRQWRHPPVRRGEHYRSSPTVSSPRLSQISERIQPLGMPKMSLCTSGSLSPLL